MLPPELWMRICSLACTDDGKTGRSLSLVSCALHDASIPYKLQTVVVRGELQIARFARHLESLPLERRNVQHIYITTWIPGSRRSSNYEGYNSPASEQALVDLYKPGICDRVPGPEPEEIIEDRRELLPHAISRILLAISSSVLNAHIRIDDYRDFIFLPVKFERLEELTLHGSFDCSFKAYIPHLPANPTLRRLRLDHTTFYHDTTLFASIAAYAPNLTHLYCQLYNPYQQGLVPQLKKLLPPSDGPKEGRFPGTLQKMILHPGRKVPMGPCGTGYAAITFAKRDLFEYCSSEPRLTLLNHSPQLSRPSGGSRDEQDELKLWFDRIHGGLGCWNESDKATTPY